jgi:hypothetical protein
VWLLSWTLLGANDKVGLDRSKIRTVTEASESHFQKNKEKKKEKKKHKNRE